MHKMYIGGAFMKKRIIAKFFVVIIILIMILLLIFIIVFDKSFAYQLELYSCSAVTNTLNREVNNIIYDVLDNSGITYDRIISVEYDGLKEIACVKADMLTVNKLKSSLDSKISRLCSSGKEYEAKIPVGNLIGGGLLYGKGFDVTVKFKPIGEVNTRMTGKLQDSGINQTIYTISFDVNIRAAVVFPFRYREIPIKIENVISETVIIGAVPESYTYFNMEGEMTPEEMQGYVEDFKAE